MAITGCNKEDPYLMVDTSALSFPQEGGVMEVPITTNINPDFLSPNLPYKWFSFSFDKAAGKMTVTALPNYGPSVRSALISVICPDCALSYDITVSQDGIGGNTYFLNGDESLKEMVSLMDADTVTVMKLVGNMHKSDFEVFGSLPSLKIVDMTLTVCEDNKIADNAFGGIYSKCASSLTDVLMPLTVKVIGKNAFSGCTSLKADFSLSEGIVTIGEEAFSGCTSFTGDFTIPGSVSSIGANAFAGCSSITNFFVKWPVPIEYTANMLPLTASVSVPYQYASVYLNATGWNSHVLLVYFVGILI